MGDDILDRLRAVGGHTYEDRMRRHNERSEAADEIERLRALITAWADADAEWRASRKSRGSELGMRLTEIEDALRKAVGR